MNSLKKKHLILSIDDDQDARNLIELFLTKSGFKVMTAENGKEGLETAKREKPDLILLDIMMPEMDGYAVCSRLQEDVETAYIPVIFVTAKGEKQDREKALAAGAVDYLVKPIQKDILIYKVQTHLKTNIQWKELRIDSAPGYERISPSDFILFKEFLFDKLSLEPEKRYRLSNTLPSGIYSISSEIGIKDRKIAQYMAEFLKFPYVSNIDPEDVQLGVLPTPFCKSNHVVPVKPSASPEGEPWRSGDDSVENTFILGNPFDWGLLEDLKKFTGLDGTFNLTISEPDNIDLLLQDETKKLGKKFTSTEGKQKKAPTVIAPMARIPESEIKKNPIVYISNNIIDKAISERVSDIHLEPKEDKDVVRFRIDGDLMEFSTLKKESGERLASRFKVLAGLDIAEKRMPQDGAFAVTKDNRLFNLRVATTSTPYGESFIIRLLEPYAKPKELDELGMTDKQVKTMVNIVHRPGGIILIVGPTGAGKTTTIYSVLHKTDWEALSLMSVEDPVEYRIPFANQQQVNEKAGVTFEALLKSAVRQDPDILFLGEVRDPFSAKMSMEFASTGHLTITSMHTTNATTAIFRIERLGIERDVMADTVLAVVAQRLIKKLCPHCKKIKKITTEETELLSPFIDVVPSRIAHPVGCPKCNDIGYYGREGLYEILEFDAKISEMVRAGNPISEIRSFVKKGGGYLQSHHAVEKVKNLIFTPKDIYHILVEDETVEDEEVTPDDTVPVTTPEEKKMADQPSILVVEDDPDTQKLITLILEGQGYSVTASGDGIDALVSLSKRDFDLVIADVNMPNLDGFKLLEMMNQKGLEAPVIFLSSRDRAEDEKKGLELGAMDYIRKPIQKAILLMRIKRVLGELKRGKRDA